MNHLSSLSDFLEPVDLSQISGDGGYRDGQIGCSVLTADQALQQAAGVDIFILGCVETRGAGLPPGQDLNPLRHALYSLYHWHHNIQLADLGNIRPGASLADTYAAVRTVAAEIIEAGKTMLILGGSHDLSLAQYEAFRQLQRTVELTCIDARMNLAMDSSLRSQNFLMEMLTGEPNFIRHYNHIGFQSYFVHPRMLETMDKLRFDCYRVGYAREKLEEMEPVLRNSDMLSIDLAALSNAPVSADERSPNGFTGDEACALMRFAGMSSRMKSVGIFGYTSVEDPDRMGALQVAQMIWYLIDGRQKAQHEAALSESDSFIEYHTVFGDLDTIFLQSKKTGRWWMQLPDKTYIACSQQDYLLASNNEIPERWLRAQERT